MDDLAWDVVRGEFAFDGGWRDIYVFGTDIADWQRMFNAIRAGAYAFTYFKSGEATELPSDARLAFPLEGECDRRLSVWFADVLANCHFFTVEEIEFDIDPREVKGQVELDALVGFMRCLAESTGKEVVLAPENCPEIGILRLRPGQAIEYQPFGGWK